MKPTNIYAVRRADGWHCTVWFDCETMPAPHVACSTPSTPAGRRSREAVQPGIGLQRMCCIPENV